MGFMDGRVVTLALAAGRLEFDTRSVRSFGAADSIVAGRHLRAASPFGPIGENDSAGIDVDEVHFPSERDVAPTSFQPKLGSAAVFVKLMDLVSPSKRVLPPL